MVAQGLFHCRMLYYHHLLGVRRDGRWASTRGAGDDEILGGCMNTAAIRATLIKGEHIIRSIQAENYHLTIVLVSKQDS